MIEREVGRRAPARARAAAGDRLPEEAFAEARGVILRTEGPQPLALVTGPGLPERGVEARCHVPRPLPGAEPNETALTVGDRVWLRPRGHDTYEIVRREARASALQRGDPSRPGTQVIVANVDQVVVVVALHRPEPSRYRLDRLLVLAGQSEVPAVVCLNKVDLAEAEADADDFVADYRAAGYDTLITSVHRGVGLAELRERLRGRTTALVGESGVGKSSLLNALYPGLSLRVGVVSAPGRGTHTTTAARLLPTPDGFIADTPGIQFLLPIGLEPEELGDFFPEIHAIAAHCRFPNCSHIRELGCVVLEAVESGRLSEARWQSYVQLYEDLAEAKRRRPSVVYQARRAAAGR